MDDDKVVLECPNCHSKSGFDYKEKNDSGYYEWVCKRCGETFTSSVRPSIYKYLEVRNNLLGEIEDYFQNNSSIYTKAKTISSNTSRNQCEIRINDKYIPELSELLKKVNDLSTNNAYKEFCRNDPALYCLKLQILSANFKIFDSSNLILRKKINEFEFINNDGKREYNLYQIDDEGYELLNKYDKSVKLKHSSKTKKIKLAFLPFVLILLFMIFLGVYYYINPSSSLYTRKILYNVDDINYESSATIYKNFKIEIPKRAGYQFDGLYDSEDFNNLVVDSSGESVGKYNKLFGNTKLYAKFTRIGFKISFDSNGGTGTMDDIVGLENGDVVTLPKCTFSKAGYHFVNWNLDSKSYTNLFTISNNDDAVLTAKWEKNTYIITFNEEGKKYTKTLNYDDELPMPASKVGYIYDGWYMNDSRYPMKSVDDYGDNNARVNLFVKYTKKKYEITFYDGTKKVDVKSLEYGDDLTQILNGYDYNVTINESKMLGFAGWSTKKDNANYIIKSVDDFTSNITLYAVWNCDTFGIVKGFAGGNGTKENPYKIATRTHLENINKKTNLSKCYVLIDNIDILGKEWNAIGTILNTNGTISEFANFTGTFDGNYYTINGLTRTSQITLDGKDTYFGLFSSVKNAVIKNLFISNVNITIPRDKNSNSGYDVMIGALVGGITDSTISNIKVSNGQIVIGTDNFKYDSSTGKYLDSVSEYVETSRGGIAGGIIGRSCGSSIGYCVTDSVDVLCYAAWSQTGGLVGKCARTSRTTIENSYASNVTVCSILKARSGDTYAIAGGLVGNDEKRIALVINNCFVNSIKYSGERYDHEHIGMGGETLTNNVCGNNDTFESSNTIIVAQNDEIKNKLINGSYNNLLQPYDKNEIQSNQYKCWIYDGSNLPKLYFEELKK